jgi:hypothetical protein
MLDEQRNYQLKKSGWAWLGYRQGPSGVAAKGKLFHGGSDVHQALLRTHFSSAQRAPNGSIAAILLAYSTKKTPLPHPAQDQQR